MRYLSIVVTILVLGFSSGVFAQQDARYLCGGDLSMATYVEDWGAKFYYADGTEGDLFDILQSYGFNFARLRIYNTPGTPVKDGSTTYRTPIMSKKYPNGFPYAGPDDIIGLVKRAKEHQMTVCLTFNLSDYWSNAATQMIPAEWSSATTTEALGDSVYSFVYRVMKRLEEQGTLPEYVSVGNESNAGILFQDTNGKRVSYGGHIDAPKQMAQLYNKAYDAIKTVSPSSQVIIHNSYGHDGKISTCRWSFQTILDNGGKFDVLGGSYYPSWAAQQNSKDNTPIGMLQWAADMKKSFGKPVVIMETGYSWTQYRPSGRNGGNYEGQLGLNGNYKEASEDGQAAFLKQLHEALETDDNIIGYLYWDPIFVDQKVNGSWIKTCWAEKYSGSGTTWWEGGNVISNTTLFDYEGKPLKALYDEMASRHPSQGNTDDMSHVEASDAPRKFFHNGQIYILRGDKVFDLIGRMAK